MVTYRYENCEQVAYKLPVTRQSSSVAQPTKVIPVFLRTMRTEQKPANPSPSLRLENPTQLHCSSSISRSEKAL